MLNTQLLQAAAPSHISMSPIVTWVTLRLSKAFHTPPGLITAVLLALPSMALAYNFLSHGAEAGNTSFQPLAQSVAKRCKEPNAFKASISLTNSAAPWHVRLAPLRLPRPRRGPHVATVFSLHPFYF